MLFETWCRFPIERKFAARRGQTFSRKDAGDGDSLAQPWDRKTAAVRGAGIIHPGGEGPASAVRRSSQGGGPHTSRATMPDMETFLAIAFALILIAGIIAYYKIRSRRGRGFRRQDRSSPPPIAKQASTAGHIPKIERLHQNLRLKTGYNEEIIQRLIQFERERLPNANMEVWMEAAIDRWERDNR